MDVTMIHRCRAAEGRGCNRPPGRDTDDGLGQACEILAHCGWWSLIREKQMGVVFLS